VPPAVEPALALVGHSEPAEQLGLF
jgi:hypothetical protein